MTSAPAGRSCPLHYRYRPEVFASAAPDDLRELDVLYVVGGVYGNPLALQAVLDLFDREKGRKRLVFNGDFHWFDVDAAGFDQVQRGVMSHRALRGNVETELADGVQDGNAGCGCAYPAWVGDEVVSRSNRILQRLQSAVTGPHKQALRGLPMWLRADVGPLRLGIVHGDAQSLAGWGFAQEHLRQPAQRNEVRDWLARADVDAFACTHTCLPVYQGLASPAWPQPRWVLNNGSTGMGNFTGDRAGLLTRIALSPFAGPLRRFGVQCGSVFADALAVAFDHAAWQTHFLRQWPACSDAYASYFSRIAQGPEYEAIEAVRLD